jgi:GDP-L-fucose synthase
VAAFFREEKPEYVFLAAARVGGIVANTTYPVDFIYDNLMIQNNVIRSSYEQGVHRLLFLGSTCIYPRLAPQPMKEEHLLSDRLEPTNEPYAVAKIAGITLCRSYNRQFGARYLTAMPTNLYGPNDNFDLETSHVLPALIRKIHEARLSKTPTVTVWGTGSPFREFLHVDDLADACLFLMQLSYDNYDDLLMPGSRSPVPGPPAIINIGSGEEVSIRELAMAICDTVGYTGELVFDATRPDGPPRKLSDVSRMAALNWQSKIPLKQGLASTYEWYVSQKPLQA